MFRPGIMVIILLFLARSFPGQRGEGCPADSRIAQEGSPPLDVQLEFIPIRAAIHLSYRQRGAGKVRITNRSTEPARELKIVVSLPGREDLLPAPFLFQIPVLQPFEAKEVRIVPQFTQKILEERTSELLFRAKIFASGCFIAAREALVPLLECSAFTWDVPARMAALVDPAPLEKMVRRALAAALLEESDLPVKNLWLSAGVFDVLSSWGFQFLEDSPHAAAQALLGIPVDRVNSPVETLGNHAGDCDDLSVLLASALEASGVPAGIGIGENHVFVLFDLGSRDLQSTAVDPNGIFQHGGRAWVPVEATQLTRPGATLLSAWNAARLQLEGLRSGETRFFEVRKAWSDYPTIPAAPSASMNLEQLAPAEPAQIRSQRELGEFLFREAVKRADRARAEAGPEPGEGDRSRAAVLAALGYRNEARELLEKVLSDHPDPYTRLELTSIILAGQRDPRELAEAREELRRILKELDPLDIPTRSQAERQLELIQLQGEMANSTG